MKLTILPNWCKWLSLALMIATFVLGFDSFKAGLMGEPMPVYSSSDLLRSIPLGDLCLLLSIVVYILSRDKRDDEYIHSIRAKSLLAALLITSFIVMIIYMFNGHIEYSYLLFIQLILYIVIFKFSKIRADIDFNYEPSTE